MTGTYAHAEGAALTTAEVVSRTRELLKVATPEPTDRRAQAMRPATAAPVTVTAAPAKAPATAKPRSASGPLVYSAVCLFLTLAGVAGVWNANRIYAPEMYDDNGMLPAADAFANGFNYAVFDLNINIRRLRDLQLARFETTPDVVVLGASHWQEAHRSMVGNMRMFNAHVHRDYWQDMLAVSELLIRHNRLPKRMIISLRDDLFTPISQRADFLWEPGIPYYRAMADRLGIEKESFWTSLPYQRMRERFSISMLFKNLTRWYNADERPHATAERNFQSLDTLLPDGSILWSGDHQKIFTPERAEREALAAANRRINVPPKIEQHGVDAFKKLIAYLKGQGVEVTLAYPPFNPIFYDRVQGSAYAEGLKKIEAIGKEIADEQDLKIIGDFNPHKVGCDASMYIDAEHSHPQCLKNVFDQFVSLTSKPANVQ